MIDDFELLATAVADLERKDKEDAQDRDEFRDKYDLLVDCAIDELNDEIIKHQLNSTDRFAPFDLMSDGKFPVYKGDLLSSYIFVGGEQFSIKSVERGSDPKSLISFVFKPMTASTFTSLVLPYTQAIALMSADFARVISTYLLPSMSSIEQDVVKLQHEYADKRRDREIAMRKDDQTYSQANTW